MKHILIAIAWPAVWTAGILSLSSCTIAFDPATGNFSTSVDPNVVTAVVEKVNDRINEELAEKAIEVKPDK